MELRFLRQTYYTARQQVPNLPSGIIARYRGGQYTLPMPVSKPQIPLSKSQLSVSCFKYRGVDYAIERANLFVSGDSVECRL